MKNSWPDAKPPSITIQRKETEWRIADTPIAPWWGSGSPACSCVHPYRNHHAGQACSVCRCNAYNAQWGTPTAEEKYEGKTDTHILDAEEEEQFLPGNPADYGDH